MYYLIYFVIFIIILLIYNHLKNKKKYELGNMFPGPRQFPIVGNLLVLINRKPSDIMEFLKNARTNYGPIFRVWVGSKLAIMVSDPHKIEVVLSSSTKNLPKNNLYDFLIPWLGDGLLLSTGRKWHNRRKIITPAFHFKILEQFVEIFDRQSFILIDKLMEKHGNGQVFDIQPFITLFALDVVCETAMGTKLNAQIDSQSEYVKAVHDITYVIASRFSGVWQRSHLLFTIFANKAKQKQDKAIEIMHKFTENIIIKRRQQLIDDIKQKTSTQQPIIDSNDVEGINKKMALLDILLQSSMDGQPLTNTDIREEVDTFMFEGHDTTTSGICFTLHLISQHADVQTKLYNEILEVLGSDKNKTINYRDLQELKYMDLVIKESLRLYPPVPIIGRNLDEDTLIDHRIIPAKSNFTMDFFTMFRDPALFTDPNKFEPERFRLDNTTEILNPYAYIPFSAGSRNCIGQKFALLEMKSSISKILRHFQLLECGENPILSPELILRSLNGIQLGIIPRK